VFLVSHLTQTLGQRPHAPLEPGDSGSRKLVRLAGRVPRLPSPGAALPGGIEGPLGFGEGVAWASASASSAAASLRRESASRRIASRRSRAPLTT
jgi:hypothetical protein